MNNIEKARQIAMAYVKASFNDVKSTLGELDLLMTDDSRLLEHIEVIMEIMDSARKELMEAGSVRELYMGNIDIELDEFSC